MVLGRCESSSLDQSKSFVLAFVSELFAFALCAPFDLQKHSISSFFYFFARSARSAPFNFKRRSSFCALVSIDQKLLHLSFVLALDSKSLLSLALLCTPSFHLFLQGKRASRASPVQVGALSSFSSSACVFASLKFFLSRLFCSRTSFDIEILSRFSISSPEGNRKIGGSRASVSSKKAHLHHHHQKTL